MNKQKQKAEVFEHWNSKKIIVHKRITTDINLRLARALKNYDLEELKAAIDFYAMILEPELSSEEKQRGSGKYWWSYRWGLSDFLMRGVPKFDGQTLDNYKRTQYVAAGEAVVIKRK